jgi:hypothetical protein
MNAMGLKNRAIANRTLDITRLCLKPVGLARITGKPETAPLPKAGKSLLTTVKQFQIDLSIMHLRIIASVCSRREPTKIAQDKRSAVLGKRQNTISRPVGAV